MTDFLTVKQFCEKYSWPSKSSMRAFILDAYWEKNNFQTAFRKVGRRVLIDDKEFFRLINECKLKTKK